MAALTNEGRCCDAVLRILEEQHGAKREDLVRDTDRTPGIDVTCKIGLQHYAVEHTLIEPFADNQHDGILLGRVFNEDFEAGLLGFLKSHFAYSISVDIYAFRTLNRDELDKARTELLEWTRHAVSRLAEPVGSRETTVVGQPPETPVRVTLGCYAHPTMGGQFHSKRYAPPDLEVLRRQRLLKTLLDKGHRLEKARVGNTRTVLVVENLDFQITREDLVGEAFNDLCLGVPYPPDDIYLVDTRNSLTFKVTQIRRARKACLVFGSKTSNWEYTAAQLADI